MLTLLIEAILLQTDLKRFNFSDFEAYQPRHIVVTKSAVRIYDDRNSSLGIYSKPLVAIPLSAVRYLARIRFDMRDDERMTDTDKYNLMNKNMFEIFLKDEFLPIYTHQTYLKAFKDQSTSQHLDKTPDRSPSHKSSPPRNSASRQSQASSPGRRNKLDMQRKTGVEQHESPSKAAKITLRYISAYHDVAPQPKQNPITYQDLVEMAKTFDKRAEWVNSDLRLIFYMEDGQLVDELIEKFNLIVEV